MARRGTADLPSRERRRRHRLRDHACDPRLRPPGERGAARRAAPRARARRRPRSSTTASSSAATARSSRSGRRARRSLACARRATRQRPCAPTSRSSGCRSTTSTSISTASARSRSTCSARSTTTALAERVGVPVEAAPLLRGAHDLVEARALAQTVLDPPPARPWTEPGDARALRGAARRRFRTCSTRTRRRRVIRELKAVGGNLRALRVALTGQERGPELWAVLRASAARRGAAPRTTLSSVRLYDTYTRSLVELPAAPGPVRMYVCGPTVYARAHIGNARPFVIGMWLRSWLRATGYDAQLVHNITDVNDKIYDAAPGASAELAARATEWYLEDTGDLGLGMPDHLPKATECVPADRPLHRGAGRGRARLRGRRRRLLPRRELPRLRAALRPAARPGRAGEEPSALKEDPRDFALWKANKPATEDTWWDSPVGPRPAGLAHRVLRDGRGHPRAGVRDPRRRARPRLPAPRERGRPVARARPSVRPDLGAQRDAPLHRREDVEVGREHRDDPRGARRVGARGGARLLPHGHWRKPIDFSPETMAQAAARRETLRNAFTLAPAEQDEAGWGAFAAALDDDFDTPAALAVLHEWASSGQLELLRRGLRIFGLGSLAERDEAPAEVVELAERRVAARAERDFETSDRLRDELAARGWEMRDEPGGGYTLVSPAAPPSLPLDARPRLRPPRSPRGAAREAPGARGLGDRAGAQGRALARRGAAEGEGRPRPHRAGGDPRPPGRRRARRALPLRRRLRARRRRAAAARGARPGHRPAQPRRGLP